MHFFQAFKVISELQFKVGLGIQIKNIFKFFSYVGLSGGSLEFHSCFISLQSMKYEDLSLENFQSGSGGEKSFCIRNY